MRAAAQHGKPYQQPYRNLDAKDDVCKVLPSRRATPRRARPATAENVA
jgi:hypothetical protein